MSPVQVERLHKKYQTEIRPALTREFGYKNLHQTPVVVKVVINAGVGRAVTDSKHLETVAASLAHITGQIPVPTVAKKSIAGFKLRQGNKIGLKVTLRGQRMYEFLDRLVAVALPRIRDFRGLSAEAFDPFGNYSLGISDQTIFPEISPDDVSATHSLQINIITSAHNPGEAKRLLELMGFPFRRL